MGRNFANKLWNAARFLLLNLEGYTPGAVRLEELPLEDRWILSRLATTTASGDRTAWRATTSAKRPGRFTISPGRSSATGTSR